MAKKRTAKKKKKELPEELTGVDSARLISLKADNILRLKAVEIKIEDGKPFIIEGNNEQGKSSVLKSLEMLLAGGQPPAQPIHEDAEEGQIIGEFDTKAGQITVTKTFTRDKSPALKITMEGRSRAFAGPQSILEALFDHISLDPLQFQRMEPKQRAQVLADIMGYDASKTMDDRAELMEKRKKVNAEVTRLQKFYESLEHFEDAPEKEESAAELLKKIAAIATHNQTGDELEASHEVAESDLEEAAADVERLKAELDAAETALCSANNLKAKAWKDLSAFEPKEDADLKAKAEKIDSINAQVRSNTQKAEARNSFMAEQKKSDDLTDQIEEIDRKHNAALMAAQEKLPVAGLGLTSDGVTYKGKPFDQAGSSATKKVSAAIAIALNREKAIKLLTLDDAEAYDPPTTEEILKMAAEAGFQVMLARVGDGESASVVIEDGQIKG